MADSADQKDQKIRVRLRSLRSAETLTPEQLFGVIIRSTGFLTDLYNQLDKNISLSQSEFPVKDAVNNDFRLIKTKELNNPLLYPNPNQRGNALLAADLIAFIDEAYQALLRTEKLSAQISDNLKKIEKFLPSQQLNLDTQASLDEEELLRCEDQTEVTEICRNFLDLLGQANQEKRLEETFEEPTTGEESLKTTGESPAAAIPPSEEEKETETEGEEPPNQPEEETKKTLGFSEEFNLAQLDPTSKLYIQSLSIITINQALAAYYTPETLAALGLKEAPSFDQLSLEARQQLMQAAFGKVENLLASGDYNLSQLIQEVSARSNFSREASLDLLLDLKAVQTLSTEVKNIAERGILPKKDISEKDLLENLNPRQKNRDENITNSGEAEQFFQRQAESLSADSPEAKQVLEQINQTFTGLDEQTFLAQLQKFALESGRDQTNSSILIQKNVIPGINTFIQQGFPAEFALTMSPSQFALFFGDVVSQQVLSDPESANQVRNLLYSYWVSKRSHWASEIRREINQEQMSVPEFQEYLKKQNATEAGQKEFARFYQRELQRNQDYDPALNPDRNLDGTELMRAYAGQTTTDPVLLEYQQQRQEALHAFYQSLAKEDQQVFIQYYQPEYQITETITITTTEQFVRQAPNASPLDFYGINANQVLNLPYFQGNQGQSAHENPFAQQAFGLLGGKNSALLDKGVNELGKKGLEWGLKAALAAATGGSTAAAEAAFEAAKQIPILGGIINAFESKILEWIKDHWQEVLIAAILALLGWLFQFLLPLLLALGAGIILWRSGALQKLFGLDKNIAESKITPEQLRQQSSLSQVNNAQISTTSTKTASGVSQSTAAKSVFGAAAQTAGQAVITSAILMGTSALLYKAVLNSAFLTDFPARDDSFLASVAKESKYASVTKKAKIVSGCSNPESNGTKCAEPSFPVTIEYEIVIKPKEDYSIKVTSIEDNIKFRQNEDAWQETEGQSAPGLTDITKTMTDFPEFSGSTGVNPNETDPNTGNTQTGNTQTDLTNDPTYIAAGDQLVLTYKLEDLDSKYMHTSITNTLEVKFYYSNDISEGSDNMKTAARICLGECSGGVGCWPTTGTITQLPFEGFSHGPSETSGTSYYLDAYDIGAPMGTPVYAPYSGSLCFRSCKDTGYGCSYELIFDDGGTQRKLLFAHFMEATPGLDTQGACADFQAGDFINSVGNRGNSSGYGGGYHLHYEVDYNGVFGSSIARSFSILETLVPETDDGTYPPVNGKVVTTCYQ